MTGSSTAPPHSVMEIFVFFLAFVLCVASSAASTYPQDVDALLALKNAWSSSYPSSWDTSANPCEINQLWLGVQCGMVNNSLRVVSLILINQRLKGNLPAAIGNLTGLQILDLSSNKELGGILPLEIGSLTSLTRLFLEYCSFSGTIPPEIGNLKSLTHLGFDHNHFTGPLPPSIGQLTNLYWLDVSRNNLSGSLPEQLETLTKAEHFHLQLNSFSGRIPSTIFNPNMKLEHLLLYNNSLTGGIPLAVGNLTHIDILYVIDNGIEHILKEAAWLKCFFFCFTHSSHFCRRMDFNHLTGNIPDSITRLTTLEALHLNNNELTGQLPNLSSMTNLQTLAIGYNQFEAAQIPPWISTLKSLSLLSMESANLMGEIPPDIFSLPKISNVTLDSNNLNGVVDLRNASPSLVLVDIKYNDIATLMKGSYSNDLSFDGNPLCISNQNVCTQSAPPPQLSAPLLDCSCPDLYAPNPTASGKCMCSRPVICNMGFSTSKVPVLSKVSTDISTKFAVDLKVSGKDQVVVQVVSATEAVVSVFPPEGAGTWDATNEIQISYGLGNQESEFPDIGPYICAFPYPEGSSQRLSTGAKIGIGFGVATLVIVILVLGAYAIMQKKRAEKAVEQNKPFVAWMSSGKESAEIPQLKGARWFSFDEIKNATNNFSKTNEIGAGGYGKVYKGLLLSGEQVAIKRAQESSLQGPAEFKTEIELLSRVHHKNLVGLIGFCFEKGEQMLVYEYMPNGSLRDCLNGRAGFRMDWERRLEVAIGAARGIAYLHTEANPPIIHRDIKSSNILLDENMVAKVADFGLCKIPTDDDGKGKGPVSSQIKGTMGYMDPDYFMTNMLTEKSDVYSFGVVLLELVTGRQPIEKGKYVVREVGLAMGRGGMGEVEAMVDPELGEHSEEEMGGLVGIAMRCVEEEPVLRPHMVLVVKELEALLASATRTPSDHILAPAKSAPPTRPDLPDPPPSSFDYSGAYIVPIVIEPK